MTAELFSSARGKVNDKYITEAITYERKKKSGWLKWGAMAACFGLIVTVAMAALPGLLKGPGGVAPPPNPNLGPGVSDNDNQPSDEPIQPPGERELTINWDNVVVNESVGPAADGARLYYDPSLYDMEGWEVEEIVAYYGWDLVPSYIPEDLSSGGNGPGGFLCREKATGKIVEDMASQGFWVDFGEDGNPKSGNGYTITASRLGIFHCGLLPVDEERTTDFGGVPVTLRHCSMKHGPFDPTQKAPDGLSNMPAGYYDIYVASFTLDGVEYEIEARRRELEEVIKITASIINVPYRESFVVGRSQDIPDKGSAPTEYPDATIVPGFDLDEPCELNTP